ncbi:MAG TPA: hypothetical protein VJY62_15255, partial [Bacteroidia bacterium]|nr:hypothetical protein [Bacteroidia bacterium]
SFNQIMGQKKLKAEILKPSKGGWLVNVMGSKGFIPGSMAMTIKEHLIKGNTINVSCINFNYAFDSFVFAPE